MKKFTLAFLYNIRPARIDLNNPNTQVNMDCDDPKTIEKMIYYFKKIGCNVVPVEANDKAYLELYKYKNKIDLAFNFSEGIYGKDREAQIPAMLEMLQIPYTGPTPLTEAIILNKAKTKEILIANNIPTARFQVFKSPNDKLTNKLKYPVMVKPLSEGSSAGITNNSVVRSNKELRKQIKFINTTFKEPALVETYLEGREFSIAMLGNPPQILPIIEADHSRLPKKFLPFDSLEVKWFYEIESSTNHLVCPAKISLKLRSKLESICYSLWKVLDMRDWCRIDIRCDKKEKPYVLEINSPPGCAHPTLDPASYFPVAAKAAGISYEKLLSIVIKTALKRYGN